MSSSKYLLLIALLISPIARAAGDSIGFTTDEDVRGFNAKLAEEYGNPAQVKAQPATQESQPNAANEQASASAAQPKKNGREKLIQRLVLALQRGDLEGYRTLLAESTQASSGTIEIFNQLRAAVASQQELRWGNEKSERSIVPNQGSGLSRPLIQVYSGSVAGKGSKGSAGSTAEVLSAKIICGIKLRTQYGILVETESCAIQEISSK